MRRFGELRRHIGGISESSLAKQLRELEADGFLARYDYKEVPPKVEYSLTELGESFIPVLEYMKQWGETHGIATYSKDNQSCHSQSVKPHKLLYALSKNMLNYNLRTKPIKK